MDTLSIISLVVGSIGTLIGVLGYFNWKMDFYRKYSWRTMKKTIKSLESDILDFNPDVIIGLSDGIVAAAIISINYRFPILYKLDVPVKFNKLGERTIEFSGSIGDIKDKKVLLVDNHVYTGTSIKAALEYLKTFSPTEIRTLVLTKHTDRASIIQPTYFGQEDKSHKVRKVPWGFTNEHENAYFRFR